MTVHQQRYDIAVRALHVMGMDWPPPPPSPFDEIGHAKRRAQVRRRVLRLMKEEFPGLPY